MEVQLYMVKYSFDLYKHPPLGFVMCGGSIVDDMFYSGKCDFRNAFSMPYIVAISLFQKETLIKLSVGITVFYI